MLLKKYGIEPINEYNHTKRMVELYTEHCPDKLPKVRELLTKYAGKEDQMWRKLETKYKTLPPIYMKDWEQGFKDAKEVFSLSQSPKPTPVDVPLPLVFEDGTVWFYEFIAKLYASTFEF